MTPPSVLAVGHDTEKWFVPRRYLEFYVLESKLTEFHGNEAAARRPKKHMVLSRSSRPGPKGSSSAFEQTFPPVKTQIYNRTHGMAPVLWHNLTTIWEKKSFVRVIFLQIY